MDYTCASWPRRRGGHTEVQCTENKQPVTFELFVSWPGVRTQIFGNNAVASEERNTTNHSITQRHDRDAGEGKVSVRNGRQGKCENQTFLLKVNPYNVCYCNTCVSQSLLMSTWHWGREAGGGTIDRCTAQFMYHCISHDQSSKIFYLDPLAVCSCRATNHVLLPSPVKQVSGDKG